MSGASDAARWLLGGLGVALGAYGAWLALTRQDADQLVEIAVWLAAGVVLHDLVIASVVLAGVAVGRRLLPRPWQAPATLALVVWGGVTLMAIPVLGRFGARSDNPTLLDRPYLGTWVFLTVLTVVVVAVTGWVRTRRGRVA
jgi:ABC-type branched-subunit amino acid transport system permease subunit